MIDAGGVATGRGHPEGYTPLIVCFCYWWEHTVGKNDDLHSNFPRVRPYLCRSGNVDVPKLPTRWLGDQMYCVGEHCLCGGRFLGCDARVNTDLSQRATAHCWYPPPQRLVLVGLGSRTWFSMTNRAFQPGVVKYFVRQHASTPSPKKGRCRTGRPRL